MSYFESKSFCFLLAWNEIALLFSRSCRRTHRHGLWREGREVSCVKTFFFFKSHAGPVNLSGGLQEGYGLGSIGCVFFQGLFLRCFCSTGLHSRGWQKRPRWADKMSDWSRGTQIQGREAGYSLRFVCFTLKNGSKRSKKKVQCGYAGLWNVWAVAKWSFNGLSTDLIRVFFLLSLLYLISALILWCWEQLMKSQELSGRVSKEKRWRGFFFSFFFSSFSRAITRNDLIFYESSAVKSEKVTTEKAIYWYGRGGFPTPMTLCRLSSQRQMRRGNKKKKG